MPNTATKPSCPLCNRVKAVQKVADMYHCTACNKHFDDDPDEGGTYSDHNPAARLEREDRAREKRAQPRRMR